MSDTESTLDPGIDPTIPDIRIALSEGWTEVDLAPEATDAMLSGAFGTLDELGLDTGDDEAPLRRAYEMQARAAFQRAREEGALAMVQFAAKTDDEPRLLLATLLIYVRQLTDPLADMVHQLAADKEVEFMDLGAQRAAVRVTHLSHTLLPGIDEAVPMHTVRYYQEIDDTPYVAVLAFTTPNVPVAEDFTELFDQMAATFSITLPADVLPKA
ncbi:MAG: hypothetical protein U0Q22_19530 [Acidimicrobiales bacterium]